MAELEGAVSSAVTGLDRSRCLKDFRIRLADVEEHGKFGRIVVVSTGGADTSGQEGRLTSKELDKGRCYS